jgi:rubredoxin
MPMTGRPEQTEPRATGARRECKICWQVYDPAEGDPAVWQIPPGTPFADLPAHWTCPNCSATKDQFLVLNDE